MAPAIRCLATRDVRAAARRRRDYRQCLWRCHDGDAPGRSAALLLVVRSLGACAAQAQQRRALSAAKAPIVTAGGGRREPARARIEDAPGPPQSGATAMMAWADPSAVGRDCRLPPNSALSATSRPHASWDQSAAARPPMLTMPTRRRARQMRSELPPPRPVSPPLGPPPSLPSRCRLSELRRPRSGNNERR